MLVITAVSVTHLAPPIVKATRVTYRVEHVLAVNLDGLECIVTHHVKKGGMVLIVPSRVKDIVETPLPVIT